MTKLLLMSFFLMTCTTTHSMIEHDKFLGASLRRQTINLAVGLMRQANSELCINLLRKSDQLPNDVKEDINIALGCQESEMTLRATKKQFDSGDAVTLLDDAAQYIAVADERKKCTTVIHRPTGTTITTFPYIAKIAGNKTLILAGNKLITSATEVRIHDLSGALIEAIPTEPNWCGELNEIKFDQHDQWIAVGGHQKVRLWNAHTKKFTELQISETEFKGSINHLCFNTAGDTLFISKGYTKELVVLNCKNQQVMYRLPFYDDSSDKDFFLSNNGALLAITARDKSLCMHDAATGKLMYTLPNRWSISKIKKVVFNPDDTHIIEIPYYMQGSPRVYEAQTGEVIKEELVAKTAKEDTDLIKGVRGIFFDQTGQRMVVAAYDHCYIFDSKYECLRAIPVSPYSTPALSHHNRYLATNRETGEIEICLLETGEKIKTPLIIKPKLRKTLHFSHDDKELIIAMRNDDHKLKTSSIDSYHSLVLPSLSPSALQPSHALILWLAAQACGRNKEFSLDQYPGLQEFIHDMSDELKQLLVFKKGEHQ
jgi:WD40 repeat protein